MAKKKSSKLDDTLNGEVAGKVSKAGQGLKKDSTGKKNLQRLQNGWLKVKFGLTTDSL
jgi:hypothetical protein